MRDTLAGKRYGTVLADPPWPETGGGKVCRGAQAHYAVMRVDEIAALGPWLCDRLLPDAHLYLWTTNNFLEDALAVTRAWGFRYLTLLTWLKEGPPGLGQYFRGQTEHVIFARRGQPPYRVDPATGKRAQGRTGFSAPRPGGHSVKPDQVHAWAERVSPGPYLELFARRTRPGWDAWGLEAPENSWPALGGAHRC